MPKSGGKARTDVNVQVTYFKKRRVFEFQKEQTLRKIEAEGAQPLDRSSAGGATAAALRGK